MPADRTLLVADGDHALRALLALTLAGGGPRVVEARDGDEALALARRERPDLVVLDVVMPGPDGIAVCRPLKVDPATAATPVIVVSAGPRATTRERAGAGADAYVAKPCGPAALLAAVRAGLPP